MAAHSRVFSHRRSIAHGCIACVECVKMATLRRECAVIDQHVVVCCLWLKGLPAKMCMKTCFLRTARIVCHARLFKLYWDVNTGTFKTGKQWQDGSLGWNCDMWPSQVEAVIRTDSWERMDRVADAVGCSHGVAHITRDLRALENFPPTWFLEDWILNTKWSE